MFDPVRHGFILGRQLAQRGNVGPVRQSSRHLTAPRRKLAQVVRVGKNIIHAKSLTAEGYPIS